MSTAVTLRRRHATDILRRVHADRLTQLLNQMARRRLEPEENDELRAAVHEALRPIFAPSPPDPGVVHETWASLLDHFAAVDPGTEAITDGAGYVREVAQAIRAASTPPPPMPPAVPLAPARAGGGVPRWVPVLVAAVVLVLLAGGGIGGVVLLRSRSGQPTRAGPATSVEPVTTGTSTRPATSQPPEPTASPTQAPPPSPIQPPSSKTPGKKPSNTPPSKSPPVPPVVFTGTAGDPTITVRGANFGTEPAGTVWNDTSCGSYTDNGKNYGDDLWFVDTGNFSAGNGGCVGIKVLTWSPNRVVFKFGNAYNTFDHWYVTAGDEYTIFLLGREFTGTIAFS
jgi:hypothetical protein